MSRVGCDQFVYFMRPVGMAGPIKIGCSSEPEDRLRIYNAIAPFPLEIAATIKGTFKTEFGLHALLEQHRSHHEWFRPAPEVLAVVADAIAGTLDVTNLPKRKAFRPRPKWTTLMRRRVRAQNALRRIRTKVKLPERLFKLDWYTDAGVTALEQFLASHNAAPAPIREAA